MAIFTFISPPGSESLLTVNSSKRGSRSQKQTPCKHALLPAQAMTTSKIQCHSSGQTQNNKFSLAISFGWSLCAILTLSPRCQSCCFLWWLWSTPACRLCPPPVAGIHRSPVWSTSARVCASYRCTQCPQGSPGCWLAAPLRPRLPALPLWALPLACLCRETESGTETQRTPASKARWHYPPSARERERRQISSIRSYRWQAFGYKPTSLSKPLTTAPPDYKWTLAVCLAYLALLRVDLFKVEPAFSLHVTVADAAQLRGRVSFRASFFCSTQTVQRLNHDTGQRNTQLWHWYDMELQYIKNQNTGREHLKLHTTTFWVKISYNSIWKNGCF